MNQLPKRFFVTGTGTGVGKTFVSAVLLSGQAFQYWKPVQSGLVDECGDSSWIQEHLQIDAGQIIPETYRFASPSSPHQAAALEGRRVDSGEILRQYSQIDPNSALLVEGAGGLLVPLNERELMIDLIMELSLPVLVVASTTLGTINHTLLTLEALRNRDIAVCGLVLNGSPNPYSKLAIQQFARMSPVFEIPELKFVDKSVLEQTFQHCFKEAAPP